MFSQLINELRNVIWGTPLLGFVVGTGILTTVGLGFVQFRKFITGTKLVLGGGSDATATVGEISPLQAFLNALSASLGNGAIAGIATAIHSGGPGAAFWVFFIGFIGMVLRFAEVFLATSFSSISSTGRVLGGPFLYLARVPGGTFLPTFYAFACLSYGFSSGCAMQCNSISTALNEVVGIPLAVIACALVALTLYVLLGGAHRIIAVSTAIVPFKVGLFFVSCTGVLLYHWAAIIPAIGLIFKAAFAPQAVMGGAVGLSVQHVFRLSLTRTINASEAGLGTAAVIYGSTGSKNPINDALSAMIGTFISTNLVCTMVALTIVASGAWQSGETGSALTAVAFQTAFGSIGGWIVSLLSILFGIGVLVAYGFVGRQCWLFLTNDRFEQGFTVLFCAFAFWGSLADVSVVWASVDIVNAACLIVNLFAILWLLPYMRSHVMPLFQKDM